jgi:hypothetical protein
VRIVERLSPRVVNNESRSIGIKAAVDEYVVAAVVDTAVKVGAAEHICKLVKFAVVVNVNTYTATDDMAV